MALYPLLLEPIYKEKVWGGRSLERFGRTLPGSEQTRIGESWEVVDLATTSPPEGGEPAFSRIRNGPLAKRSLNEALGSFGMLISGTLPRGAAGGFPLLLKYLDARENVSVQVHPSPEYAGAHPEAHLKSEAWYVVAADPGALIYHGVKEGTTEDRFRAAIAAGTVPEHLVAVPARVGDCHYLPSGRCHALGAGTIVAEIQTASDTTFRVFDWQRTDRELHVDEAMACIDFGSPRPSSSAAVLPDSVGGVGGEVLAATTTVTGEAASRPLISCDHFGLVEWKVLREATLELVSDDISIVMVVEGTGALQWGDQTLQALQVRGGDTVLLPAALARVDVLAATDMTLLEVMPPGRL